MTAECFEVLQLAATAHLTRLVQRSLRSAAHRQDAARRSADTHPTSDPRRVVTQVCWGGSVCICRLTLL